MTKQNTTARPWTAAEDAILGTNTLVKIAANLNRPTSQIQKRMKQLGVPHFGVRVKPRSSARVAAEQALAERGKARLELQMRKGIAAARLVCAGRTLSAAAREQGVIGGDTISKRLLKFARLVFHPKRLGQHIPPPIPKIERVSPQLLDEIERRMEIEFATGSLDVWAEPLPVMVAPGAAPTLA